MSDNVFGKILKGTAKLACSYMTETGKRLSKNEHYTEEARSQFSDISDTFSDFSNRLDYSPQSNDEECFFEDSVCNDNQIESVINTFGKQVNNTTIKSQFNQITFAGYQWYVIHRDNSRSTALLLSKDIIEVM